MENPAKKIIEKIKEEHVVPESRFRLNWKSYLFWGVWILTLLVGALFFSFIILNLLDIHPGIFHYFGLRRIFFLIMITAPYFWIALAALALFSGFLAIRKTKHGYRYGILFATSLGVLIVSLLGVTLHMAKINERVGQGFFREMPKQRGFIFPVEERWSRPEEKMLGGEIIELKSDYFMLVSFKDEIWEVRYFPDTEIRLREQMGPGISVGIIGEKTGERKFEAEFIHSLPMHHLRGERCQDENCVFAPMHPPLENFSDEL